MAFVLVATAAVIWIWYKIMSSVQITPVDVCDDLGEITTELVERTNKMLEQFMNTLERDGV